MGKAQWGAHPEFFGPRHAHREGRIVRELLRHVPTRGKHLECAAGVGSLSVSLARVGFTVVAADLSLLSLTHVRDLAVDQGVGQRVFPVVADIHRLPFADATFGSCTSAETLEHINDHHGAARELGRTVAPGGWLVGTVPADPRQWSEWDDWGGHLRRYDSESLNDVFRGVGLEPRITVWGWPVVRVYDDVFLKRVNRRRLDSRLSVDEDPALRRVSGLGKKRWLVRTVRTLFELDRLFDGVGWGVGLLFAVRKSASPAPVEENNV